MSFGLILQNIQTEDYKYYKAYSNSPLFERPLHISKKKHLNRLKERMLSLDISKYVLTSRPNSAWKFVMITNVRYYITSTGFLLGQGALPNYIKYSSAIISLE